MIDKPMEVFTDECGNVDALNKLLAATERGPRVASDANAMQIGGDHYLKAIQPWDYIAANNLGFFEGNVVKYVSRWKDKGGIDDLKKAKHYIEKLIEVENGK